MLWPVAAPVDHGGGASCFLTTGLATVAPMDPADLEGKTYGPLRWRVANDDVSDFIDLTGDDPERWSAV